MPKTAVIYARQSTEEQSEYSLASQVEAGRAYAATAGYLVVGEFTEYFTGTTLDRPQLNEVAARAGEFDVLIVYKSDRLSRDMVDLQVFHRKLFEAGSTVEYILDPVDMTSSIGGVMLALKGWQSEEYIRAMREQMNRGRVERVRSGKVWMSNIPPYGYLKEGGTLVINEVQAVVVRQIYRWYVYGDENGKKLGTYAIAERLTAMKVPTTYDTLGLTKKNRRPGVWSNTSVANILSNETYAGRWIYKANRAGKRRIKQDADPIVIEVPAIISQEVFALARQQASANKKNSTRNSKHPYLLRNRLRCAKCGYAMRGITPKGSGKTKRSYYRCLGNFKHYSSDLQHQVCHRIIRREIVEDTVWSVVGDFLKYPEMLIEALREQRREAEREIAPLASYLATCEQQLADAQDYRHNLVVDYSRRRIPDDIYDKELFEVERQITDYQAKIADYQRRMAKVQQLPTEADVETMYAGFAGDMDKIDHASYEEKLAILELFNVSATLDREDESVTVEGYFPTVNKALKCLVNKTSFRFTFIRRLIA